MKRKLLSQEDDFRLQNETLMTELGQVSRSVGSAQLLPSLACFRCWHMFTYLVIQHCKGIFSTHLCMLVVFLATFVCDCDFFLPVWLIELLEILYFCVRKLCDYSWAACSSQMTF